MARQNIRVQILGLQETLQAMGDFGRGVRNRVIGSALMAGSTPTLKVIKWLYGNQAKESGLLQRSVGRKRWVAKRSGTVAVIIGPRKGYKQSATMKRGWLRGRTRVEDPTHIAHLIEGGVRPHAITGKKGRNAGRTWQHPGFQGRYVMKRGWHATRGQAFSITRSHMAAGVTKEAQKAASKKLKRAG